MVPLPFIEPGYLSVWKLFVLPSLDNNVQCFAKVRKRSWESNCSLGRLSTSFTVFGPNFIPFPEISDVPLLEPFVNSAEQIELLLKIPHCCLWTVFLWSLKSKHILDTK